MKPYLLLLSLTFPLLMSACYQKGSDAEDSTNPHFAQAEKFESEENFNAAVDQYEKALQANPSVAKAYEKMGDLYSEKLGDPISAIYCYQKYLKARPNAEDRDLVANYIDKAKHDFALTLPPNTIAPAETGTAANVSAPANSVTVLSGSTQPVAVEPTVAVTATTNAAPATAVPPVNTQNAKSYTIQKGDSLWKIAKKFYPKDVKGGIEKIKQANPQTAANDKELKLGTTLVIP